MTDRKILRWVGPTDTSLFRHFQHDVRLGLTEADARYGIGFGGVKLNHLIQYTQYAVLPRLHHEDFAEFEYIAPAIFLT